MSSEKLRAIQIPSLPPALHTHRFELKHFGDSLVQLQASFSTITTPLLAAECGHCTLTAVFFPLQCQDFPTRPRPPLPPTEVPTYEAEVARCTTPSEQQLPLLPSQPTAGKELWFSLLCLSMDPGSLGIFPALPHAGRARPAPAPSTAPWKMTVICTAMLGGLEHFRCHILLCKCSRRRNAPEQGDCFG